MSSASKSTTTIAFKIPQGVSLSLGAKINLNGHELDLQTVNWETNSCLKADYLEQRLLIALEVLDENYGAMDDYEARIQELKDNDELIELED
ncbi:hypothetical protein [uncultured Rheinheimera sp.]|uniref:hypothetical protein n=1 Tax=uncultured Rheinheimera sp. TaxID=400532 RepID=UPI002596B26C|nr:hypothetical protein [uncultured Rheinheimera sp.]